MTNPCDMRHDHNELDTLNITHIEKDKERFRTMSKTDRIAFSAIPLWHACICTGFWLKLRYIYSFHLFTISIIQMWMTIRTCLSTGTDISSFPFCSKIWALGNLFRKIHTDIVFFLSNGNVISIGTNPTVLLYFRFLLFRNISHSVFYPSEQLTNTLDRRKLLCIWKSTNSIMEKRSFKWQY